VLRCCNKTLDACGVCGGNGVAVDVQGRCCSKPLSSSGTCCDYVDDCGVCDGISSCVFRGSVVVGMDVDPGSSVFTENSVEFSK
jgi:hypothetical protein